MTPRGPVIAVAGPTAAGKSALAVSLARKLQTAVLSVDSVAVYRGFDIGAAKPDLAQRSAVPHHLIDIAEPNEIVDARRFVDAAWVTIESLIAEGRTPVLSVGTTMYFTAVMHGLIQSAPRDDAFRASVSEWTAEQLYEELRKIDPDRSDQLHVNDRVRIVRALEVARVTGRSPSGLHAGHGFRSDEVRGLVLVICRDRRDLYARIDARASEMIRSGLIAEVKEIVAAQGPALPALQSIGYREVLAAIEARDSATSDTDLTEAISTATRQYAKRQMTFWRNEPVKRGWIIRPDDDEVKSIVVGDEESRPSRTRSATKGFRAFHLSMETLCAMVTDRLKAPFDRTELWYVHPSGW